MTLCAPCIAFAEAAIRTGLQLRVIKDRGRPDLSESFSSVSTAIVYAERGPGLAQFDVGPAGVLPMVACTTVQGTASCALHASDLMAASFPALLTSRSSR